ncbi:hypothetical protein HNQ77_000975 [Silvibacterium bohemicum]|uniref:Porin domain-containing protein n=1 Tax=Silvibacterium bohemicum TaxID=1577686 RepID=A0A841JVL4_9BACT|nr:hypothetical protein [Silvibacterium bohemicum]MBB6143031.1 hypothetical protein [Silvibacterium bohemicum]
MSLAKVFYQKIRFRAVLLCWESFVLAAIPICAFGQTSEQPGKFAWKPSGFENLVIGGASQGRGGEASGSSESEVELTPQYKTKSGTVFAARGVLNLQAASNVSGISSGWNLTVPELSLFAIGHFGRIEIGDRAGFPQSLVGFTPSEIAFTSAEFGPESGERLDPNGGLPTVFLPHPLADRINDLTYLGYAERFYSDRSLKLIYVTPRSRSGFYGAASYTPTTDISSGYSLNGDTRTPDTGLRDAENPGVFRNITQAALVWTHRTQNIDVSAGSTYSYATTSAGNPIVRDSNSLSEGITATVHDAWTFGLSGTYDGFSKQRNDITTGHSSVSPYGVVASANYVEGPWTVGGYYQHATALSVTSQPSRDTVDIGEGGVARLINRNHDLLGAGFYTDVKLFASLYYYRFQGAESSSVHADENGPVLLFGARFSFF